MPPQPNKTRGTLLKGVIVALCVSVMITIWKEGKLTSLQPILPQNIRAGPPPKVNRTISVAHARCAVIHTLVYDALLEGSDEAYARNLEWANRNDCAFFAYAIEVNSCSDWRNGIRHWSWCMLQELSNVLERGSFESIVIAGGTNGSTVPGELHRISVPQGIDMVVVRKGVYIFPGTDSTHHLACKLWDAAFQHENIHQEEYTLEEDLVQEHNDAQWTRRVVETISIKRLDLQSFSDEDSKWTTKALAQKLFRTCVKRRMNAENVGELLYRDLQDTDCPLQIRFQYARDMCKPTTRYEFPKFVVPDEDCGTSEPSRKHAVAMFFTELGGRFEKALKEPLKNLPKFAALHSELELLAVSGPLKNWNIERVGPFLDLLKMLNTSVAGRLKFLEIDTIQEDDIAPYLRKQLHDRHNCCGWSEHQKLGLWTLEAYDSILHVDVDVSVSSPLDSLFHCASKYDFLSTIDPQVALQGGFYLLKPNRAVYEEAKRVLAIENLYNPYSGWNETGPLFSPIFASQERRRDGKYTQAFAMETPQGFLFWLHHIHLPRTRPGYQAAQLEVCQYNYRQGLSSLPLYYVCPRSIAHAKSTGTFEPIPILVCHGCAAVELIPQKYLGSLQKLV